MKPEEIETLLERLRIRWKQEPENRPIIERQARALQIAKEKRAKRTKEISK